MPCHPTEFYCLSGSLAAANFSPPPLLQLIPGASAILTFQTPYELMGVTLSSTLTNFGTANMGVFVLVGVTTPKITFATSTPVAMGAVSGTNSIVGPPALPIPSDKVATTVLLQPILIKPGMPIALYAFGDTTAGNALLAVASLVMRRKS